MFFLYYFSAQSSRILWKRHTHKMHNVHIFPFTILLRKNAKFTLHKAHTIFSSLFAHTHAHRKNTPRKARTWASHSYASASIRFFSNLNKKITIKSSHCIRVSMKSKRESRRLSFVAVAGLSKRLSPDYKQSQQTTAETELAYYRFLLRDPYKFIQKL